MPATFEQQAWSLWSAFCDYTNTPGRTLAQVIAAETKYDDDYEDLCFAFSHPPKRPNRKR